MNGSVSWVTWATFKPKQAFKKVFPGQAPLFDQKHEIDASLNSILLVCISFFSRPTRTSHSVGCINLSTEERKESEESDRLGPRTD